MEEQSRRRKGEEEKRRLGKDERERTPPGGRDITLTTQDGRPLSREELIQKIKRGESPTWTIRHGVSLVTFGLALGSKQTKLGGRTSVLQRLWVAFR
jgi:hypothetical protein